MSYQLWFADAARDWGLEVVEVDGWKTRGKAEFNPRGLIWHHTATPAKVPGDYPTLSIIINGRPDVPGPLSQFGLGRSGTVYVVAAGKANHAGDGQWDPLTEASQVVGIEAEHPGLVGVKWPEVQLDAYYRLSAAILEGLGSGSDLLCGHKEWAQPPDSTPNRKVDPIGLDMTAVRAEVARRMQEGPGMAFTPDEEAELRNLLAALKDRASNGYFAGPAVDLIRATPMAAIGKLADRVSVLEKQPAPSGMSEGDVRRLAADEIGKRIANG